MNTNEELLSRFYSAFQNRDYQTMQACYHDNARFNDAVFTNLNANQVKAMWEMLCKNGKDLQLEFKNVSANDHTGKAYWIATYTFSKTGNKVVNRIQASFKFKEGLIIDHQDQFSFYGWASQALGLSGKLLGWTPFLKVKVQQMAMKNLESFMSKG